MYFGWVVLVFRDKSLSLFAQENLAHGSSENTYVCRCRLERAKANPYTASESHTKSMDKRF